MKSKYYKNLDYKVFGDKKQKTIILLSGWLHNFENEKDFLNKLTKYFRVITVKYPGYYGATDLNCLPEAYTYSDIVYSLIKKLKLKNFILLGFSLGCQIVLHTVSKYKLKNKIILISPTTHNLDEDVPYVLRLFIKNRKIFELIRKNSLISKLIVNMAYNKISRITQGKKVRTNGFKNSNITLNGAFDTLYFVSTNFINPKDFVKQTKFIFGSNEILQHKFNENCL